MSPVLLLATVCLSLTQSPPPLPDLALETYPPAAREMLGRAHRAAGARPSDADAALTLGRALQAWEQWEAAHQAYRRAQALAPGAFAPRYLDAVVLQRLARHRDAAERLKEALAIDGTYLPARLRLAEALYEGGELERSEPLFRTLVKEPAAEPAALVGLGRIAARQGRHDTAIEHYERAVALFPELGAAHYGLARAYRAVGRREDAARAIEAHGKFGPRWPALEDPVLASVTGLRDDPRAMVARAVADAAKGDVASAIALHQAALEADPSLVQAPANLVTLHGRAKNWAAAAEHYRTAVEAGISTADLHYDYGVIQSMQENWAEAEQAYRRALDANPLHAQARNNLGQLLERGGDVEEAAREYAAAVEARPSFRLARFNLGRMFIAQKRVPAAIAAFEQLQQPRDAETPRYLFALAAAYVMAGRTGEGKRLAVEARDLAAELGQGELAAAIARELEKLK